MKRQRQFPEYLSTIGLDPDEFIWEAEAISAKEHRKLKKRAAAIAKKIAADWLAAKLKRSAEIEKLVAADKERAAREQEAEETKKLIDRMIEADLPKLRAQAHYLKKERAAMARAVKRERQKLAAAVNKLARAKMARFRNRR